MPEPREAWSEDVALKEVLALIGLPGSGKSTIGKQLAKRLGWSVQDADTFVEKRAGVSIRSLFESHGESHFRDLEEGAIQELVEATRTVLSTGGGAVLRSTNRERLRSRCHVVYLHATPEDLARRLRNDTARPLLQVQDPLARLRDLYAERDPLYRATAHFVVDTGRPTVASLVNMVLMQLELSGVLDPARGPLLTPPVKPPR